MTLQLLYLILQHDTKPQMLFMTERFAVSKAAQLIANFLSHNDSMTNFVMTA